MSVMRRSRCAVGVLLLVLSACTQRPSQAEGGDASVPVPPISPQAKVDLVAKTHGPARLPTSREGGALYRAFDDKKPEHPTLAGARTILAQNQDSASLLDERARGLRLGTEGFVSAARQTLGATPDKMNAVFGHHADEPMYFGAGHVSRWAMSLTPKGAAPSIGLLDRGRVIYTDVYTAADVIAHADDRWVEQLVVLRDARAPSEFRFELGYNSGLHLRDAHADVNGAIELLDGKGDAAFRISRPVAVDATGRMAGGELRIEDGDLVVSVDTKGLKYPIVLDPVVEVPVWQLGGSGPWSGLSNTSMAYSSTDGKLVLVGGSSGSGNLSDTYEWSGSAWTPMSAPTGVSNRQLSAVAAAGTDSVVVFGGLQTYGPPQVDLGDTWAYHAGAWSQVCASGSCAASYVAGVNYVSGGSPSSFGSSGSQNLPTMVSATMANTGGTTALLFGVDGNTYSFNRTASPAWSFAPLTSYDVSHSLPPARLEGCMAGDPTTGHAYLFGGRAVGGSTYIPAILGDSWEYNPTAAGTAADPHWKPLCGPGSTVGCPMASRHACAMTYDPVRKKIYLTGGDSGSFYGVPTNNLNDLWELDPSTKTWTQLQPSSALRSPGIRYAFAFGFDTASSRAVRSSGSKNNTGFSVSFNDTWTLYIRGGSCATGSDCDTGTCFGGTCCESTCSQCQTCALPGSEGTCANIPAGQADTVNPCASGGQCNGAGACKTPVGSACTSSSACALGNCVNGYCCSVASCASSYTCSNAAGTNPTGVCQKLLGVSCTSNPECSSGACVDTVCCSTASCPSGSHCNYGSPSTGACLKDNGQACTASAQCGSGNCVDGVCCNRACTNQCEACDAAGSVGTCVTIAGAVHPNTGGAARTACSGAGAICGSICNGSDATACHAAPTSTSCGLPSCASGIATLVGNCDGSGSCVQTTASCGAYKCDTTACKTTCASDTDCSSGSYCNHGACVGAQALGYPCTEKLQCASGYCTDGVCCSVASCGTGSACAAVGPSSGQCQKVRGSACTTNGECATARCVDGYCCDAACDGQCEACDVKGSEGTCTPVTGTPHMPRAACDTLKATDCAHASCDGAIRDKCGGFANGTSTSCGADACTSDKKVQAHGNCDGKGACAMPEPTSCVEYACDPTTFNCHNDCASDTDCNTTFRCDSATHKCVQGASCSKDGTHSIDKSGASVDCAPYRCGPDGSCLKACAASTDCVQGTSCDTTNKACVAEGGTTAPSGGCSVSANRSGATAWILGIALAFVSRRRRLGARK